MDPKFGDFYAGRRVLVTGHTGFKGAWLCRWLINLGAKVTGLALDPPSSPSLFGLLNLARQTADNRVDIRDFDLTARTVADAKPEVVFHMAAQALVRPAHSLPLETFDTNTMGTAHVLHACLDAGGVRGVVAVTSDKCYLNQETGRAFCETDPLGGHEPYSTSKAAAEMVVAGYGPVMAAGGGPALASVRSGNIIGGGDWAVDRIIPDLVRAATAGEPLGVRAPEAVRPWQHVLEPLAGYLELGRRLAPEAPENGRAYNFGPGSESFVPVRELVDNCLHRWPQARWRDESDQQTGQPRESGLLCLDSSRAGLELDWRPRLTFGQTVAWTIDWYRDQAAGADAAGLTDAQIRAYSQM